MDDWWTERAWKMKEHPDPPPQDIGFYSEFDSCAATAAAIEKILAKLPSRDRWCVEFGAWDGLVGSTSRDLIMNHGYSAGLIEGSRERFAELQRNYAGRAGIIPMNRFVGFTADDGLDALLAGTPVPQDFDFLTVDIDGNDYHVWNAIIQYRPKVVMIEFNPTIPPEVCFVQPADPALNVGNSLAALIQLGKQKGYELVAVVGVNAFFAAREFFAAFEVADNRITALWTKRDCVTYFFTGYNGEIFLGGCCRLPWHENIPLRAADLQVLPAFLRTYPYTRKHRLLYNCLTKPAEMVRKIFRRMGC